MRRFQRVTVVLLLALLLAGVACSESSAPLQFNFGPLSEHQLRVQIRQVALLRPIELASLCSVSGQLSDSQILKRFAVMSPFITGTPAAQAQPAPADEARAVEIIEEECERLT